MFYSSETFTFKNVTLTTTLFSIGSDGAVSFNSMIYPAGGVSAGGKLTTSGTLTGASIVEGGVALSSKYLQSATLGNYVLKAGDTMTGALNVANLVNITGATDASQSLSLRTQDYNIGIAGVAGNYSSWAAQNDMIIRSVNKLILQSGNGGGAILINSANNVGIGNSTPTSKLCVNPNSIHNGAFVSKRFK
jgi:hypothetical protein